MCLLYEVGIIAARIFGKPALPAAGADKLPEAEEGRGP
jgi:hypothetical protein